MRKNPNKGAKIKAQTLNCRLFERSRWRQVCSGRSAGKLGRLISQSEFGDDLGRGSLQQRHVAQLVFGLRDAESSYLLDDLQAFVKLSDGGLRVTVAFSQSPCPPGIEARYPALCFATGLVHDVLRERFCANERAELKAMQAPLFLVGGPPLMVNATMRTLIVDCKASPREIRYDRFG